MLRAIGAAILGYVVMVVCVLLAIAATWSALGNQFAFAGESTTASTGWSLIMLACGFVAANVGGLAASKLAGRHAGWAVNLLAGFVLVMGVITCFMQMTSTPLPLPEGRTIRDLSFAEAGQYAVSPAWYNVAIVFAGVTGVLLGGRCCRKTEPEAKAETSTTLKDM